MDNTASTEPTMQTELPSMTGDVPAPGETPVPTTSVTTPTEEVPSTITSADVVPVTEAEIVTPTVIPNSVPDLVPVPKAVKPKEMVLLAAGVVLILATSLYFSRSTLLSFGGTTSPVPSPTVTSQQDNPNVTQTSDTNLPEAAPVDVSTSTSPTPTPTATPKATAKPTATPSPKPTGYGYQTQLPSSNVTSTPTPTPTATPHVANPPYMSISYPQDGQSITMNSTQSLCVVDAPAGGGQQGLQRRSNINNGGWSAYGSIYTYCQEPKEGSNIYQFQYKNSFGDESQVYTRQFIFHRQTDVTITISGHMFIDNNCNSTQDSGESNLAVSTGADIEDGSNQSLAPNITTNGDGTFSFSKTILGDASQTIKAHIFDPSGYATPPNYSDPLFTLNASNKTASVSVPEVPSGPSYLTSCSH